MRTYHLAEYPHQLRTEHANKTILRYFEPVTNSWVKLKGEEVATRCLVAAKAFAHINLKVEERVGIYSQNSVRGLCAELGLYMMRGVSVPLYATSTPDQVEFIVRDASVRLLLVGDQFQYNNAYEVQKRCSSLERIIILDNKVVLAPEDHSSMYYDEFVRRGDSKRNESIANVTASQALSTDMAVIIYTSGTSGNSKGVVLRHSNFSRQIAEHRKLFTFVTPQDVSMCFLPLSHIFEKTWTYFCLNVGCSVAILSDPKKILEALPRVHPTMMCNVPRFWEKVYAGVLEKIEQSPSLIRSIFRHAIETGRRYRLDYYNRGLEAPWHLSLMYRFYELTLFKKLKKALGLQRGRFFPTAGATLSVEVNQFLQSVGIPICLGYGLSESTATVSCFPQKGFYIDSIGKVVDYLDVRIDPETQEIQLKGPTITEGYFNNPEANAEAFTEDGYFRTGDAGRLEKGVLYFTERIKDLFKTANGKYIAPQMLEGLLVLHPIIEQVAIIGDGRKFVTALICPNWDILRQEAKERGIDISQDNELLATDHEVHRLITVHIEQALSSVAQYEQVKKFCILPEPFTLEGGELTNTLKLKRKVIYQKYATEIERMYQE